MVSSVNLSIGNEKMTIPFAHPVIFGTPKYKLNAALGLPECRCPTSLWILLTFP